MKNEEIKNVEKNEEIKNEVSVGMNNGLISNDISIFKSDVKRLTSLDLSDSDSKITLLNAMQNCDIKLIDVVDQVLEINGCYVEERPVEDIDNDTGEVKVKSKYVTMLFGTDGKSYVAGSYGVYTSLMQLASVMGLPSKDNVYKVKTIKVPARIPGHSLLKLILVK